MLFDLHKKITERSKIKVRYEKKKKTFLVLLERHSK